MQGSLKTRLVAVMAALIVTALAGSAWAQGYTLSNLTTDQYETPPATGATRITLQDDQSAGVTLPFSFPYFGVSFSSVNVCSNGFIQFGGSATTFSNQAFPLTSTTYQGICAPLWDDLNPLTGGTVEHWTVGSAPNRKWIISWTGVPHYGTGGGGPYFIQAHLHESSGRIVFAYDRAAGTWTGLTFTHGINSPTGDSRYKAVNNGSGNTVVPPNDYAFDPTVTTFTGRVLLDEIVADANGIDSGPQRAGRPAAFVRLELLSGGGFLGSGLADANGDYQVNGLALRPTGTGTIQLVTGGAAGQVLTTTGGSVQTRTVSTTVDFSSPGTPVPTFTVTDTNDADKSFRRALQIAIAAGRAYDFVSTRTSSTVPTLNFVYDVNANAGSIYTPRLSPTSPPLIRIASAASGNDDAFDPSVITRIWGHHAAAAIAGAPAAGSVNHGFDTVTSTGNAFSEGFGAWLHSVISGETVHIDAIDGSSSTSFDIEDPAIGAAKGPDVGGWVAAALWDLSDPDNEAHDLIDGSTSPEDERPLTALDALTAAPTPRDFERAWTTAGFDTEGLVRNFVFHGLLPDDAFELNDTFDEASDIGVVGVRLDDLVLQPYSDDWYLVQLPADSDGLFVDMSFNRFTEPAEVTLEITDLMGTVIATGVPNGDIGPIEAATGSLLAGDYLVHVGHDSGPPVTDYTLQIYSHLRITGPNVTEWTVGRPLAQQFEIEGGIPPYTLSVKPPNTLPAGVVLTSDPPALGGSLNSTGDVSFPITVEDDGDPTHTSLLSRNFHMNARLEFSAPELTGAPLDKPATISLGRSGGTPPFSIDELEGALPPGLAFDTNTFEVVGTATVAGGQRLSVDASDLAGSAASLDTQIVVCVPFGPKKTNALMAAGDAAAGFYFDALSQTVANIVVKTLKKQEKRDVRLILIGPDGSEVDGGILKLGKGKAILKKVTLPDTGRYYAALDSATGGETTLVGALKPKVPTKFAGSETDIGIGDAVEVTFPALEGATFKLVGKVKGGLAMRVEYVIAPDGTFLAGAVFTNTDSKGGIKMSDTLDQSGDWTFRMTPQAGARGNFKYKLKIKNPKGAVYSVD